MIRRMELVADHILYMAEEGTIYAPDFEASVKQRLAFVKEHVEGFYVIIYDLTKANLAFIDLRLARWGMEVDPNLVHVIGFDNNQQRMGVVTLNLLTKAMKLHMSSALTLEEAKQKAETLVAADIAKRSTSTS
ncbi:MAG: hypothetical protein SGI73_17075 [Chloroflexota bacterium]|nr:hypothetical protein [Chloroflexota bacterium]